MAASVTEEWFWQIAVDKAVGDNYIFQKSLDRENIFGITWRSYDAVCAKKISKTWINFRRII